MSRIRVRAAIASRMAERPTPRPPRAAVRMASAPQVRAPTRGDSPPVAGRSLAASGSRGIGSTFGNGPLTTLSTRRRGPRGAPRQPQSSRRSRRRPRGHRSLRRATAASPGVRSPVESSGQRLFATRSNVAAPPNAGSLEGPVKRHAGPGRRNDLVDRCWMKRRRFRPARLLPAASASWSRFQAKPCDVAIDTAPAAYRTRAGGWRFRDAVSGAFSSPRMISTIGISRGIPVAAPSLAAAPRCRADGRIGIADVLLARWRPGRRHAPAPEQRPFR